MCVRTTQNTAHMWRFDFNLRNWFFLFTMDSGVEFMASCLCPMCFSPLSHLSKLENFVLQFESESLISECRQFWFHLKTLRWLVVTLPHVLSRLSFVTAHHVNLMIALIIVSLKTVPLHSTRVGHNYSCHMNKRSHTRDTAFMPCGLRYLLQSSVSEIFSICVLDVLFFPKGLIFGICASTSHKITAVLQVVTLWILVIILCFDFVNSLIASLPHLIAICIILQKIYIF